jgi:class 3 adenylate cyclase/tetratricopeptide (TPR) repeat protein
VKGLRRHVPELAIEWQLEAPDRQWQAVDGTLCFADISGFTKLAERLAQQGRIGGEELIETLSRVFGAMLERARERDGMLLKFGGDALLFLFRGPGHALRAASTAVEMRAALRRAAEIPTSVGRLQLSMSVGLHSGQLYFFLVGGAHRELVLAGPSVTAVVMTEGAAASGEIALSAATAALLPGGAVRDRGDGTLLLRWRQAPLPPAGRTPEPVADDSVLRQLFPAALCDALSAGPPEPEHRVACIAFIRFSGTDALLRDAGPDALARALQTTVATAQAAFDAEGVTLLTIDIDKDGGKFFVGAGVPRATEDDEGLMLRALRRIIEAGTPLPLQFGVNRGHVFVAEVGTAWRAAYSAMGDTTNTAARICAKALPGTLYAHPSVLDESRTLFETTPEGPFTFKGKKTAQLVYRVGAETGTRAREGREQLPLTGRDAELAQLRERIDRLTTGRGEVITIQGPIGLGKTRLIGAALSHAQGVAALALRAEPNGASSPYRVFRDVLRQILGIARGDQAQMAEALARGLAAQDASLTPWAALVGDVAHIGVEPSPEVAAIEPRFRPGRTADVVLDLLARVHRGPLVIVMDDAHWCDEASGGLLGRIAQACATRPWLLFVARRTGEGGFTPADGTTLELEPLSGAASTALLTAATEAAPLRPHEMQAIVERAGGNPLFIEEIVYAARVAGSLEAVPGSLEAAIAAQLDRLDESSRRLVRYAAVLGNTFRRSLLAALLHAEGVVLDAAVQTRADAFLEPQGEEYLRFRRGLVRDLAYEGLAFRVRQRLHRLAGEATERDGGDLSANAGILAWHFSLAGDATRTWRYARASADFARRAYANPEAASHYRLALDAARRLPDVPAAERLATWTSLGDVCLSAGMFGESLVAYRNASRLVRDDPVAAAELARLRAIARERSGEFDAALREIATGRRLLRSQEGIAARGSAAKLAALAALVRFGQQHYGQSLRQAEAAIAEARAAGDKVALAEALVAADSAQLSLGQGSAGRMREALAIYEELGDLSGIGMVRGNLGCEAYLAGRWDEALDWFAGDRESRQRAGNTVGAAVAAGNIGEIFVRRGRLDEAEVLLRDSARVKRASGFADSAAYTELQLARALVGRGASAEALSITERVGAEFAQLGQPAYVLEAAVIGAVARVAEGQADAALKLLAHAEAAAGKAGTMLVTQVAEARAQALAALGDDAAAELEIDRGLSAARRLGLLYEEAQLLITRIRVAEHAGRTPEAGDVAESRRILDRLGADPPQPASRGL